MDIISLMIGIFALTSTLAGIAASFYSVRQKTIIITLESSNKAYAERNKQLETDAVRNKQEYDEKLRHLEERIKILERIKTPPLKPLIDLVTSNHNELKVMLKGR